MAGKIGKCAVLVCLAASAAAHLAVAQVVPPKDEVSVEIEGLEGATAMMDSVTLSITRDLRGARDTYGLSVLLGLSLTVGKVVQLSWNPIVAKVLDEEGKELPVPSPGKVAGSQHAVSHERHVPLSVSLPLQMPLPRRLSLIQAEWRLRMPAQIMSGDCEFRSGASLTLGTVKVMVTKAQVDALSASMEASYETSDPDAHVQFEVLGADGNVLVARGRSRSQSLRVGGGRRTGTTSESFSLAAGQQPSRIRCTWPTKFREKDIVVRIRNLPIPSVP